jgi:pSer/pThr/pTyr-binding forkhead associated (FHA) protein
MPKLIYHDSDGIDRVLNLGSEPVLIGRAVECQVQTQDAMVSRRHARIVWDGNYWIEDLGSSNGVYVGTDRVKRAPFRPGDTVTCGSLILRLVPEVVARPTSAFAEARTLSPTLSPRSMAATDVVAGGAPFPAAYASASTTQLRSDLEREVQRRERAEAAVLSAAERIRDAERRTGELDLASKEVDKLRRKIDQLNADLKRARGLSAAHSTEDVTRDDSERTLRLAAESERDRLRMRVGALELQLANGATNRPASDDNGHLVAELREQLRRVEGERDVARRQATQVRAFVAAKAANPSAASATTALGDALTQLRVSLRSASDEAAQVTTPETSVRVLTDALSQAVADLEAARAALRALSKALGEGA